jgi:hypothetical protein
MLRNVGITALVDKVIGYYLEVCGSILFANTSRLYLNLQSPVKQLSGVFNELKFGHTLTPQRMLHRGLEYVDVTFTPSSCS